jgi:hypothetical protein
MPATKPVCFVYLELCELQVPIHRKCRLIRNRELIVKKTLRIRLF